MQHSTHQPMMRFPTLLVEHAQRIQPLLQEPKFFKNFKSKLGKFWFSTNYICIKHWRFSERKRMLPYSLNLKREDEMLMTSLWHWPFWWGGGTPDGPASGDYFPPSPWNLHRRLTPETTCTVHSVCMCARLSRVWCKIPNGPWENLIKYLIAVIKLKFTTI